ncbi:MAG: phosphonate utilization associated transcriptional regulator [Betaproteobacteria bacterium]|nr:phosphonate utilization associated transcriptional regulator [Betaproteobacteria bacterium]
MVARVSTGAFALELLRSHSLTNLARQEIEQKIMSGELPPGAKLNENTLAAQLGVSRGPVREALRALEQTGLVRVEKNRGVFVRQIPIEEADEIYELRAALEQMVGSKLARTITRGQLKELHALIGQMDQAVARGDLDAYHSLNLRFHGALVEFAGNRKLAETYRRLVNELNLFRKNTLAQDHLPTSVREHRNIADAIESGKVEIAGALLYEHVMASRERMRIAHAALGKASGPARPAGERSAGR